MEIKFAPELESFREQVRRFVEDKVPTRLRERTGHEDFNLNNADQKEYVRLLNDQGGWSCPSWPTEYGRFWSCFRFPAKSWTWPRRTSIV